MRQIKRFTGNSVPNLKSGEWSTDEDYAYLGIGFGKYRTFQGVLDLEKHQEIDGFVLKDGVLYIPSGTPLSKLQHLVNVLPKSAKRTGQGNKSNLLQIVFEDGTYVNDTGDWLIFRDFTYSLLIRGANYNTFRGLDHSTIIDSDHSFEFYSTNAEFRGFRFNNTNDYVLYAYSSNVSFYQCSFDNKTDDTVVSASAGSNVGFVQCYFKTKTIGESFLLEAVTKGSSVHISECEADQTYHPKAICKSLENGIVTATCVSDLHITQNSPNNSGIEILGEGTIGANAF